MVGNTENGYSARGSKKFADEEGEKYIKVKIMDNVCVTRSPKNNKKEKELHR